MAYLLIADDDEDFASAAATVLRDGGHEVEIKLDIESAAKSMEEKRPDLLILDVMFPEDSTAGFTLARSMRHYNDKLKGIPVLMLTAVNIKFPLGFSEQDIDEVAAGIKARGGTLDQEPTDQPWGARDLAVSDPDGFKITISNGTGEEG